MHLAKCSTNTKQHHQQQQQTTTTPITLTFSDLIKQLPVILQLFTYGDIHKHMATHTHTHTHKHTHTHSNRIHGLRTVRISVNKRHYVYVLSNCNVLTLP